MSDIKREWIDAGAEALLDDPRGFAAETVAESVLAAVLPLIAQRLREHRSGITDPTYAFIYSNAVAHAADLIWKEDTDERPRPPRRRAGSR